MFVLDFYAKAQIFNNYFVLQSITLDTTSETPPVFQHETPVLTGFD